MWSFCTLSYCFHHLEALSLSLSVREMAGSATHGVHALAVEGDDGVGGVAKQTAATAGDARALDGDKWGSWVVLEVVQKTLAANERNAVGELRLKERNNVLLCCSLCGGRGIAVRGTQSGVWSETKRETLRQREVKSIKKKERREKGGGCRMMQFRREGGSDWTSRSGGAIRMRRKEEITPCICVSVYLCICVSVCLCVWVCVSAEVRRSCTHVCLDGVKLLKGHEEGHGEGLVLRSRASEGRHIYI